MAESRILLSLRDGPEFAALLGAAAVVLCAIGERGELKSYDREIADLWSAVNAFAPDIHDALTPLVREEAGR